VKYGSHLSWILKCLAGTFVLAGSACSNSELLVEDSLPVGTISQAVTITCNTTTKPWLWDATACGGSKGYNNNGNTSYAAGVTKLACDATCANTIKTRYDSWMASRYTDLGTTYGRIKWEVGWGDNEVVSEGQAYGIYATAMFDDHVKLERLTRFFLYNGSNSFQDEDGLMHWNIICPDSNIANCKVKGTGAAGDADFDAVHGWALACKKCTVGAWASCPTFDVKTVGGQGGTGKSYCDLVNIYEDRTRDSYVDMSGATLDGSGNSNGGLDTSNHPSHVLMAGDEWKMPQEYPQGIGNISYYDPALFRAWGSQVSGQATFWTNVIERQTAYLHVMQEGSANAGTSQWVTGITGYDARSDVPASCSKLPMNWNDYSGRCARVSWHGDASCDYHWDAPRTFFRLARDYAWNNQTNLQSILPLQRAAKFFASLPTGTTATNHVPFGNTTLSGRNTGIHSSYHKAHALATLWAGNNMMDDATCKLSATCGDAGTTNNWCKDSGVSNLYGYVRDDTEVDYFKTFWRFTVMALVTGNAPNPFTSSTQTLACKVNNTKDGSETDVDCGGPCTPCTYNKICTTATDCNTGVCTSGKCAAACSNGKQDGNETGIDCGGACTACTSCSDSTKNGTETDVDCGGATCGGCANGKICKTAGDCTSNVCSNGLCVAAANCNDQIKNQGETGIDCGGPCATSCNGNTGTGTTPEDNATPLPGVVSTDDTGKANTLGAYCYKIKNSIQAWNAFNAQGRTVSIKRKNSSGAWVTLHGPITVGAGGNYQQSPDPNYCAGSDGYIYVCLSAATNSSALLWAGSSAWGPAQGTCN
jgi:hypothetical protein